MFSKEKCYESQKATELFRKNVVSNNFSKEGRYHNLVNGQKLLVRGNFCSKCSPWNLYFMLFHIVFIVHLTKFANRSPLCLCSQVENSEQKNHPWTKEKKQRSPEKNERTHFCVGKKTKTPIWEPARQSAWALLSFWSVHLLALIALPQVVLFPFATLYFPHLVSWLGGSMAEWLERRIWKLLCCGFKSHSDRQLMFFSVAPSSTSRLCL